MRLLIISDMAHYYRQGTLVGWGPTVEEINHLATIFSEVRHLGCLHAVPAPGSALPYNQPNITFIPLPPTGGNRFQDKWGILRMAPRYLSAIWKELSKADVVHLRCPANIPFLALLVLVLRRKPRYRWVKYAGNWGAGREYPASYRLQRWILQHDLTSSVVTINGTWSGQSKHLVSFPNPCLEQEEVIRAGKETSGKCMQKPLQLIFVGALNERKGMGRVLEIVTALKQQGVEFHLHVLGDGDQRKMYEKIAADNNLQSMVTFHGWLPKPELAKFYRQAHINLLPSASEGFPKVLSEGMAYGVVPLAGAVASIPKVLELTKTGITINPYDDIHGYLHAIEKLHNNPDLWLEYSGSCKKSASMYTYEEYLFLLKNLFPHINL